MSERRIEAAVKQWKLAARLDIPAATLCHYENGHRPIPQGMQERILKAIEELQQERDSAEDVHQRLHKAGETKRQARTVK